MEKSNLDNLLDNIISDNILKFIISNPINASIKYKKIIIEKKNQEFYVSKFTEKQVFNNKLLYKDIKNYLIEIYDDYKQYNFFNESYEHMIKKSKKGKILYRKMELQNKIKINNGHNREKNYILKENQIIQPLIDMGIYTKDGKIINSMYDKYKQINRFLEIIDDSLKNYNCNELNVIDFGCGKSYLTFILYYYLTEIKHIKAHIIGLDLKEDVIKECNIAAKKYNYNNLEFKLGDIKDFVTNKKINMIVTLHACDTATDFALYNAIKWNVDMIFSVPCCQHELNKQIKNDKLNIITRYGIVKERVSALYTDIIRCNLLECLSYKVQLMEFVDLDNTPKNLLIRAYKTNISLDVKKKFYKEVKNLINEFNLKPKLLELIKNDEDIEKDFYE